MSMKMTNSFFWMDTSFPLLSSQTSMEMDQRNSSWLFLISLMKTSIPEVTIIYFRRTSRSTNTLQAYILLLLALCHAHTLSFLSCSGGIVVFDLAHRYIKWSTHLDMTTKTVRYAAYMIAPPAVVDIDQDGHLEIVVGNNAGFLYVLDSKGDAREGWPKQMGYIMSRPLVADLNDDGKIEILAGDIKHLVFLLY